MNDKNWAEQFTQSLISYQPRAKNRMTRAVEIAAVEQRFRQWMKKAPIDEQLWLIALDTIGKQFMGHEIHFGLMSPSIQCESPIELPFYFALVIVAKDHHLNVTCKGGEILDASGPERLEMAPQAKIGKYRVDFWLTLRSDNWLKDDPRITNRNSLPSFFESQVIVECDGHEFHERTKEQAMNDRQKDRLLQEMGFKIFRFTGAEIWADVFKCAEQTISVLREDVEKQSKALIDFLRDTPSEAPNESVQ